MPFHKPDPWIAKRGDTYLAQMTGFDVRTIRKLIRAGELPGRRLAGSYVVFEGEFDALVAGQWPIKPIGLVRRHPLRDQAADEGKN